LKMICASGWSSLLIQRIDSTTCEASITKTLGAGS
jgi:hypothetical protein